MNVTITIDAQDAARQAKAAVDAHLALRMQAVGATVVSQIQARFDSSGDPDMPWPDLWANNTEAVLKVLRASERKPRREAIDKAKASVKRAKANKNGTRREREARVVRAEKRLEKAMADANPHYRQGGKPMLDTGASRASFFYDVTKEGEDWVVTIGSPLKHLVYHQEGFKTQGPNRVPITMLGAKGGGDIGVDFAVFRKGVTVPPRPMVRFTEENMHDIRDILAD